MRGAHGLASGTYVSPHVDSVTERLSLCGQSISAEEFAETYHHLMPFLERVDGPGFRVTYFETLTALAYLWFADKPVDLAVFEVGMGGTWDATNLVRGDVAVLCPVGIDHQELGSTVGFDPSELASPRTGETFGPFVVRMRDAMRLFETLWPEQTARKRAAPGVDRSPARCSARRRT